MFVFVRPGRYFSELGTSVSSSQVVSEGWGKCFCFVLFLRGKGEGRRRFEFGPGVTWIELG